MSDRERIATSYLAFFVALFVALLWCGAVALFGLAAVVAIGLFFEFVLFLIR